MASPNVEGAVDSTATGGNKMGVIIGYSPTETLGFFGILGVTQPTSASVTDYASLKVALQNLGLVGL